MTRGGYHPLAFRLYSVNILQLKDKLSKPFFRGNAGVNLLTEIVLHFVFQIFYQACCAKDYEISKDQQLQTFDPVKILQLRDPVVHFTTRFGA